MRFVDHSKKNINVRSKVSNLIKYDVVPILIEIRFVRFLKNYV